MTISSRNASGRESMSESHESSRWLQIRDESDIPSEPSTPAASTFTNDDSRFSRSASRSRASSSTTTTNQPALNIDAEDEDVKIAIMALGAMKHLDGSSRARGLSINDAKSSVKHRSSSRSIGSTGISSSSSSTPATDNTAYTFASSSASASTSSSTPATLADLPPDFQFPAIIHDEHGNEMRVEREDMADDDFLKRVSHLPIVRGTLRAYEIGKQRSRVMRYGGNLVESSVKAISRPVVSRIGAHFGDRGMEQLDDFACRQLERIYPHANDQHLSKEESQAIQEEIEEKEQTEWKDMTEEERAKRRQAYTALKIEERERAALLRDSVSAAQQGSLLAPNTGTASSMSPSSSMARSSSFTLDPSQQHKQRQRDRSASDIQRKALIRAHSDNNAVRHGGSGWSSMLVEAGVTAGGLSAAMSEESMKSLKYCLQWLQYATAHIEHQITILRDLIVKLNHGELDLSSPAAENLSNIKGDVVETIRNVVQVVGKYAGGALPEPARASVKAFILSLPARWAAVNRPAVSTPGDGRQGSFGGSPASPSFSSMYASNGGGGSNGNAHGDARSSSIQTVARQQAAATAVAANRVLTLAVESLDILRSVTVVFGESLDRADLWVERLRVLGLQRKRAHEQAAAEEAVARIDAGMGGALARNSQWESARGLHLQGSQSPGTESNLSIGTTASSKRRRIKRRGTLRGSASPGPFEARSPALGAGEDLGDRSSAAAEGEEGSSTETERVEMARGTASSGSSSAGGAVPTSLTTAHQPHYHHPHGSTMSHRRSAAAAKARSSGRQASANKAFPSGSTPVMQNLTLQEGSSAFDSSTTVANNTAGAMETDDRSSS